MPIVIGMGDAKEALVLEASITSHCNAILKADADWEKKNRAVIQLTLLVESYRETSPAVVQELFGMNIFRLLKEPMKFMIGDLRSQQIRDTCYFLTSLSEVLGDHLRHFLRDVFPCILDGVKVSNKVMSGFVDDCIISLIRNTTFKAAIPVLLTELAHSKAKVYRERCLDYINEILVSWDIGDKDADLLLEAIRIGLEDASVRGREIARLAYLNMFQLYPKKTDRLKAGLLQVQNKTLVARLDKEEDDFRLVEQQRQDALAAEEAELDCMPEKGVFSRISTLYQGAITDSRASLAGPVGRLSIGGDRASNFFSAGLSMMGGGNMQIPSSGCLSAGVGAGAAHNAGGETKRFSIRESYMASIGITEKASSNGDNGPLDEESDPLCPSPFSELTSSVKSLSMSPDTDKDRVASSVAVSDSPPPVAFRTRRESIQDTGATCIQAALRGALTRRKSLIVEQSSCAYVPELLPCPASSRYSDSNSTGTGWSDKENMQPVPQSPPARAKNDATPSLAAFGSTLKSKTPRTPPPLPTAIATSTVPHGPRSVAPGAGAVKSACTGAGTDLKVNSSVHGSTSRRLGFQTTPGDGTTTFTSSASKQRGVGVASATRDHPHDRQSQVQSTPAARSHSSTRSVQPATNTRVSISATATKLRPHFVQSSTVKKRAQTVAAMTSASVHMSDSCVDSVASFLKIKIAKTLELVRSEMALVRRLEQRLTVGHRNTDTGGQSLGVEERYTAIGDGMGAIDDSMDHGQPYVLAGVHNKISLNIGGGMSETERQKEDEQTVRQLMSVSSQHIQLCRNFEDRFNTALLSVDPAAGNVGGREREGCVMQNDE